MIKKSVLQAFVALEQLGRPDISKTKTSRESDKDIDTFSVMLAAFVAIWLLKGFFTPSESLQLALLFHKHAENQYFRGQEYAEKVSGLVRPVSQQDLDAIKRLSDDAQRAFMTELETRSLKSKPSEEQARKAEVEAMSNRTASDMGIRALNQGTLSRAHLVQFVTRRDRRVCPICEDHDGDVYEVDPRTGIIKEGPLIPDDLHPNCRCRYLVIGDDEGE